MTPAERDSLKPCMQESCNLPGLVAELSRQLGRATTAATTPETVGLLVALRQQSEAARNLLIAVHDGLATAYLKRSN